MTCCNQLERLCSRSFQPIFIWFASLSKKWKNCTEFSHKQWKAYEAMSKGVVGSGSSPLLDQSSRCFLQTRSSIFPARHLFTVVWSRQYRFRSFLKLSDYIPDYLSALSRSVCVADIITSQHLTIHNA